MPTVLLLDRSLSMGRNASSEDVEGPTKLSVSLSGLRTFTERLSKTLPHEYISLMTFSSKCEVIVPFTKNHEDIQNGLTGEEFFDRSDLHLALESVIEAISSEWGAFVPCQIIIVTDGLPGLHLLHTKPMPVNFHFPVQLHTVVMATKEELTVGAIVDPVSYMCTVLGVREEQILFPAGPVTEDTVRAVFTDLARKEFRPFCGTLKCGHLSSSVSLYPSPYAHSSSVTISTSQDGGKFAPLKGLDGTVPSVLEVCGFVEISSVHAPPILSRHLVLDATSEEGNGGEVANGDSELKDPGQNPSFRVLLHGSLKVQSMVAIVRLRPDWFGLLYSGSEAKSSKKANLVISILHPGSNIPWLGDFDHLGLDMPTGDKEVFPISPPRNLSFQNPSTLFWISDSVLQSDLTKLVRHSRKLPDKETQFLKEYNKLRMTALSYCSQELLATMVDLLEVEKVGVTQPRGQALLEKAITFLKSSNDASKKLAAGGSVV